MSPTLLPDEQQVLFNIDCLNMAVEMKDYVLVSKLMFFRALFGDDHEKENIVVFLKSLAETQGADGGFGRPTDSAYRRIHCTLYAARALLYKTYSGYAPMMDEHNSIVQSWKLDVGCEDSFN